MASESRTLIYVPILHSQGDMGSLGRRLAAGQAYHRQAQARWDEIVRQIQGLELDWPRVKVYQDGLPDTTPEILGKILAEVQSPNYDLLRWLVSRGAQLVGTESPALLEEEYGYLRAVVTAPNGAAAERARHAYAARAAALLAERDAYVARRIAATLLPGGVGILFLGQAHQVASRLPADVTVRTLAGSPSASALDKDRVA